MFVGSAAISSPIYGVDGEVVAAMAIGAPADRFTGEVDRLREIIVDVAKRASGVYAGNGSSADARGASAAGSVVEVR